MGDKVYQVVDELVLIKIEAPGQKPFIQGYYRDQFLPANATEDTIEHHLSTKQIQEVDIEAAPVAPAEAETPPPDGAAKKEPVKAGDDVPVPKKTDPKEAWVDFAVSKGADRADIEAKKATKDDLIAVYGPKN